MHSRSINIFDVVFFISFFTIAVGWLGLFCLYRFFHIRIGILSPVLLFVYLFNVFEFADVPDIVCQEYAVPQNMQNLIPKIPGGYMSVRNTPPSFVLPKPPPVPPPPEKYYATTAICKTMGTMGTNGNGNNIHTTNTMPLSSTTTSAAQPTATTNLLSSYNDTDATSTDDDLQLLNEFPRHSLVIVEKLGSGAFGELHLCETKGLR